MKYFHDNSMTSKHRKFRIKDATEGQVEDSSTVKDSLLPKSSVLSSKPEPRAISKSSLASNLLSFDEEVDDGPMSMAPAKHKKDIDRKPKMIRSQALPELPTAPLSVTTQRSNAGEYSAERLKELQRSTLSARSKPSNSDDGGLPAAASAQPVIKLSGSFKVSTAKDDRYEMGSSIALVKKAVQVSAQVAYTSVPQPASSSAPSQPSIPKAASTAPEPSSAAPDEDEDEDGGFIPDIETIKLAKAKRERLRQAHLAPDYIPLQGILNTASGRKKTPGVGGIKSSTMTGSGATYVQGVEGLGNGAEAGAVAGASSGSEEEPEEAMRLRFTVDTKQKRDTRGYAATVGSVDDEEDGEESFANEQLRKAVRRSQASMPQNPPPNSAAAAALAYAAEQAASHDYDFSGAAYPHSMTYNHSSWGSGMPSAGSSGLPGSSLETMNTTASSVMTSLKQGVERLNMSHQATQSNLSRASGNMTSSLQKIEGLEIDMKRASDKYVYMQKIKAYIADLCECLADKSPMVEALEDSLAELREDRAAAAGERVKQLEQEMMESAEAAVSAALGVLSRGGAPAAASAAAEGAARAVEELLMERDSGPPELDEFGRNVNMQRDREAKERGILREKALEAEKTLMQAVARGDTTLMHGGDVEDVAVSHGEELSEVRRYWSRHDEIMETAETIFVDAGEEFASVRAVKSALEEFKLSYPKDYNSTYMHLSTPALFAPYVRLELLSWDPLYADGADHGADVGSRRRREGVHKGFDKQLWYETLFDYGCGPSALPLAEDDADGELVPQLVRKLVLPVALNMLERCWSASNLTQTKAAAALLGDLFVYIPAEEERMQNALSIVVSKLEKAVSEVSIPPWPSAVTSVSILAEAVQFRRFRQVLCVMRCIACFEGLLARSLLLQLSATTLAVQQALPYLRSALAVQGGSAYLLAVIRLEAVAAALPPEWFQGGLPKEAGPLGDHINALARTLEGQSSDRSRGALALRVATVAGKWGCADAKNRLASAFGFKV
ncbi:hypothetical protein CEUSTIGMA_g8407.t1 [Chlamydomonas eustigma]|uniref:GCF C-terminal domain-containing protein n=1 Tax=Chlamydomonas eustigma TaxID=1157962 RepID=A0A250XDL3_9CHLO|nr:hypothetical protein CEUSTIGMA_g8407.t1 [Chlamydomonas eustigma]|eukprot:GAX80972.1 hypothetical protein CEUSTIGMA_g8407.t1 [Chlamydomonas eustigma]